MALRLSIKRPIWADVTEETGTVLSDEYLLENSDLLYRLRKEADGATAKYSAREALAIIKKWAGENNNTLFGTLSLDTREAFLAAHPLNTETPFPDDDMDYFFHGTATVSMTETFFCIACSYEYCW